MSKKFLLLVTFATCGLVNLANAQQKITSEQIKQYCEIAEIKSSSGLAHATTPEKEQAIIQKFCNPVEATFPVARGKCENAVRNAIQAHGNKIDEALCEVIREHLNQ